jgi:glycine/D-amino acid oxidase-like deaminating enzyme
MLRGNFLKDELPESGGIHPSRCKKVGMERASREKLTRKWTARSVTDMDLLSGNPYWPTTFPQAPAYPGLAEDIDCDVLIVGAGCIGAQIAYILRDTGLQVVVADRRRAGQGSTRNNTGFLQMMGDKMIYELADLIGEQAAIRHTKLCEQAIRDIDAAARNIPVDCEFTLRDSLYTASTPEDAGKLKREFDLLVPNGFRVDWWSENTMCDNFPFTRPSALYTRDDAEINPYKYTIGLLEKARERGVRIYEQTDLTDPKDETDAVVFHTNGGHRIRAKHAIIAAGYETLEFCPDRDAVMSSTYAVVTEPIADLTDWYRRVLIWETARPYTYMRTTRDNRIIIGSFDEDAAAGRDTKLLAKKDRLIEEFRRLFPRIPAKAEYDVGGVFASSHDGLPRIAEPAEIPRCTCVYAFGDNGLVYGMLLAVLLRDKLTGTPNEDMELYLTGRRAPNKSS